jgi:hypothetical protein
MEELKKSFSVCYSGGIDSTFISYLMGRKYQGQMHLLTMLHGYGQIFKSLSKIHVGELKQRLGEERIFHSYLNTHKVLKELFHKTLWQDYAQYHSNFIWCLSCNLAFDILVIIYNLENQVPITFFGATPRGEEIHAVMSMQVTTEARQAFYKEYGINYRVPLVEETINRDEERQTLKQAGFYTGFAFRRRNLGIELLCLPGNVQHCMDTFFDKHPIYNSEDVKHYIADKQPLMHQYLKTYFQAKGQDLQALVQNLKTQNV